MKRSVSEPPKDDDIAVKIPMRAKRGIAIHPWQWETQWVTSLSDSSPSSFFQSLAECRGSVRHCSPLHCHRTQCDSLCNGSLQRSHLHPVPSTCCFRSSLPADQQVLQTGTLFLIHRPSDQSLVVRNCCWERRDSHEARSIVSSVQRTWYCNARTDAHPRILSRASERRPRPPHLWIRLPLQLQNLPTCQVVLHGRIRRQLDHALQLRKRSLAEKGLLLSIRHPAHQHSVQVQQPSRQPTLPDHFHHDYGKWREI